MSLMPVSEGCPPAYGGCTCSCHHTPGTLHIVACCSPQREEGEWIKRIANVAYELHMMGKDYHLHRLRTFVPVDAQRVLDGFMPPVTDEMAEAAAREAYGDQHYKRYQNMMKRALTAALNVGKPST